MLDMLHSYMLVMCTYHCSGVYKKYFLVWLLFFVDLSSQKLKLLRAPKFSFHEHKAPSKAEE